MKLEECPSNQRVFICMHVFEDSRPISLIVCDDDADLHMLCGEDDHDFDNDGIKIVGLGHLRDRNPKMGSVSLTPGFQAELQCDEWTVSALPQAEKDEHQ